MSGKRREGAASEILGAILLVSLVITGLSIISVMLLSSPSPSSSMKSIIGVKCSKCPNLDPNQYDILIDHEGGENLSLQNLKITLFTSNRSSFLINNSDITVFRGEEGIYTPPVTCDGKSGELWGNVPQISAGQSMKYSFNSLDQPKIVLIQGPSSIGYSTVSQLSINYIQNLTNSSTQTGYYALNHTDQVYFDLIPDNQVPEWSTDGCNVSFTYVNAGPEHNFAFGNTQQSMWNYLQPVSLTTSYEIVAGTTKDVFPANSSGISVNITHLKGRIVYNLGSMSTDQVNCPGWE